LIDRKDSMPNSLRGLAIATCLLSTVGGVWGGDYLSNLGNRWVDPGNPGANSIGDGHTLLTEYDPFVGRFFTGLRSAGTAIPAMKEAEQSPARTNPIKVVAFELHSVTFEFIWGHLQAWSNVNVKVYQLVGDESKLLGDLGNPAVNPALTQWPESLNPSFCTTYVDYHPLSQILLQPLSEYSVVLSVPSDSPPNFGLLFSVSSNYVTTTDWRMGATTTHYPWADGEFLKLAVGATAILGTNSPPMAIPNVFLSATKVGTNLLLSWPVIATQYHLYAQQGLQQAAWAPVSTEAIISNDNFVITLPISGAGCYFRLQSE
jgi:hypothetical protein